MFRVIFRCFFLILCAAAAVVPLFGSANPDSLHSTPEWPEEYGERLLDRLPESDVEARFNASFPGAVARFTDGERQFIFRWITTGTRKLHSSAECFRGLGYKVKPGPALLDQSGAHWSCFTATRGVHHLRVRERIADTKSSRAWTDASAWFWSVAFHQSSGPWLATTIVESE